MIIISWEAWTIWKWISLFWSAGWTYSSKWRLLTLKILSTVFKEIEKPVIPTGCIYHTSGQPVLTDGKHLSQNTERHYWKPSVKEERTLLGFLILLPSPTRWMLSLIWKQQNMANEKWISDKNDDKYLIMVTHRKSRGASRTTWSCLKNKTFSIIMMMVYWLLIFWGLVYISPYFLTLLRCRNE